MDVYKYSSEYHTGQSCDSKKANPVIGGKSIQVTRRTHVIGWTRRSIFSCSSKGLWDAAMTNRNKAAVRG